MNTQKQKRTVLHLPAKQVVAKKTSTKIPETAEIVEAAAEKASEVVEAVSTLHSVERLALELAEALPEGVDKYATTYADSVQVQRKGVVPIYKQLVEGYGNQIARFPRPDSKRDPHNPELAYDVFDVDKKRGGTSSFYKCFAADTPEGEVIQDAINKYSDETLTPNMNPHNRDSMLKAEKQRMNSLVKFYKDGMKLYFQFIDFEMELKQIKVEFLTDPVYDKDQITVIDRTLSTSTYPIGIESVGNPKDQNDTISVGQFLAYDVKAIKERAGKLYDNNQWRSLVHRNKKDTGTPGQGRTQPGGTDAAEGLNVTWGTEANVKVAIMHLAQVVTWLEDKEHSVSITSIIKGKDKEAKADLLITLSELKQHIDPLISGNEGFISAENLKRSKADEKVPATK